MGEGFLTGERPEGHASRLPAVMGSVPQGRRASAVITLPEGPGALATCGHLTRSPPPGQQHAPEGFGFKGAGDARLGAEGLCPGYTRPVLGTAAPRGCGTRGLSSTGPAPAPSGTWCLLTPGHPGAPGPRCAWVHHAHGAVSSTGSAAPPSLGAAASRAQGLRVPLLVRTPQRPLGPLSFGR